MIQIEHQNKKLILLTAASTSLLKSDIKVVNNRDLQSALPYALEEQLAQNVEELHFSWVRNKTDTDIHVIVVTNELMQRLGEQFTSPDVVVLPGILALPVSEKTWCIVIDDQRALVRTGVHSGFECHKNKLQQQIKLHLRDHGVPKRIQFWSSTAQDIQFIPEKLLPITKQSRFRNFHDWIKNHAMPEPGLNLLSSQYAIKQKTSFKWIHWLPAFSLILLTLTVHFGYSWYQINKLETEQQVLLKQSHQILSQTFPDIKKVVEPKFQAEQELRKLNVSLDNSGTNFFTVFGHVMKNMRVNSDMKLLGFTWINDRLDYQIEAKNVTSIEAYNRKMINLGFDSEIINFVNDKGKSKSQMRIRSH